jgi:hypothetical protein
MASTSPRGHQAGPIREQRLRLSQLNSASSKRPVAPRVGQQQLRLDECRLDPRVSVNAWIALVDVARSASAPPRLESAPAKSCQAQPLVLDDGLPAPRQGIGEIEVGFSQPA